MRRTTRVAAVLAWIAMTGICVSADLPPAWLSSLQPGDAPPQPRDVTIVVDYKTRDVAISACIVSNLTYIYELGFEAVLFDKDGHMLPGSGQATGEHKTTVDRPIDSPNIFFQAGTGFKVRDTNALALDKALVTLEWRSKATDGYTSTTFFTPVGPGCKCEAVKR